MNETLIGQDKVTSSEALGIILGFGVFACTLAFMFSYLRRVVYHDQVDITFKKISCTNDQFYAWYAIYLMGLMHMHKSFKILGFPLPDNKGG